MQLRKQKEELKEKKERKKNKNNQYDPLLRINLMDIKI